MTEHKVGTQEEWQTARDELAGIEAEHAELGRKVAEKRRELPWVPVDKNYELDTAEGKKTLADALCAEQVPELREIRPGQFAACHHPLA